MLDLLGHFQHDVWTKYNLLDGNFFKVFKISSSRGIGIIIGPAIGGFFAQPAEKYHNSFLKTLYLEGEEWKKCQCYKKISILILQKKTRL
ncbi:hypothetical protein L2E82_21799 [Cichorium intybus]|uniref:Uncharacterized protein n=1 Tax=Cichorium intybus TaxID=13427 RepID=A0ACB9DXC9_CICIN|nr:hypothetical protein L2E82_21799 [Cichorium intybus]